MQHFLKYVFLFWLGFFTLTVSAQNQKDAIEKLLKNEKYKEANQLVDKELASAPNDAALNYLKWRASSKSGMDVKERFRYLNRAIELDSAYSEAYTSRGSFYMQLLKFDDAKEDIDAAIKFANTDSLLLHARLLLAAYYTDTRQFQQAVDVNLRILKDDSLNPGALNNLAMGYQDLGEMNKALEVLYKVEKLAPDAGYVVINIGFVLTKTEDYKKAISYFDKAEKMAKNEPLVYSNRAYAKYHVKDYGGAMADINKSIKLFPTNSYAYWVRALIYLDQKNTDKACDDLNTALGYKYTQMYGDAVENLRNKYCIR